MRPNIARRALIGAAAITLLAVPSVSAETVGADGDTVAAGLQTTVDLGMVAPGVDVPYDVSFVVTCSGTNHVDAGQMVRLSPGTRSVPSGGGVGVGTLSFALPAGWPADGASCPAGLAPFVAGPLHIILSAPATAGVDYTYRLTWNRAVTPIADPAAYEGTSPTITFVLDVGTPPPPPPVNTPPILQLPANSTVEGSTTGGAPAAYAVSAIDAEDAVAPTPSCSPAVGALLPVGTNTISCSATDGGSLSATGSFTITVVDTTAPSLAGMPGNVNLSTTGSSATLVYGSPTATDVVDPGPTVGCLPASGSSIPVGDTTVTCTARDASGNSASASFTAHVTYVAPPTQPPADPPASGQAFWESPVHGSGSVTVKGSRTLPVKVRLMLGGKPVTGGAATLSVVSCSGGGSLRSVSLHRQGNGRWVGHLWTVGLGEGCFKVVAGVDGQAYGSFTMDIRGHGGACKAGKGSAKR